MPVTTQCPACQRKLRVPDELLGKRVRCPACKETFMADGAKEVPIAPVVEEEEESRPVKRRAPPSEKEERASPRHRPAVRPEERDDYEEETPEEEEIEEETPQRRRRRKADEEFETGEDRPIRRSSGGRAAWSKVRTGVTLILVALCIFLVMILVAVFGGIVSQSGKPPAVPRPGPPAAPALLLLIVGLIALTAVIVRLVGNVMCLSAPPKHGAKNLAIAALVLSIVALLAGGASMLFPPVNFLGHLAGIAELFVFLFFLRALARCIRAADLEHGVKNLLILYAVMVGGLVLMVVVAIIATAVGVAAGQGGANVGAGLSMGLIVLGVCGCAELLLALTALIWYVRVLIQTRNQIGYYLDRR